MIKIICNKKKTEDNEYFILLAKLYKQLLIKTFCTGWLTLYKHRHILQGDRQSEFVRKLMLF